MKQDNALLENLTRSSLRLNKGVMILLGLALLLVGTSFWSFQRLIEEHHDTVRFHFARLLENIQEQEAFLRTLTAQGTQLSDESPQVHLLSPLPNEGPNIYQGQAFSFSLPFSVKLDKGKVIAHEQPRIFGLGANLADLYSTFWSASHFPSPQVFLFGPHDSYDITVPAAGRTRGKMMNINETFVDVLNTVRARTPQDSQYLKNNGIDWRSYVEVPDRSTPARLLAYVTLQFKSDQSLVKGSDSRRIAASLLDLSQINDFERIMDWLVYDRFTLIAPDGEVLIGIQRSESHLHEGMNLKPEGLVFKLVNHDGPGWAAIYTITFKSFFRYAFWSLTTLLLSFLAIIGLGWLASRWYKKQVILPARQAHQSIAESEAFSRVVIDTAPTGLCVVRCADQQILLKNQRAQQWQGTVALVTALDHQDNADTAEHDLEIDGRHLQVGSVATRYQGQDVRLYAFNDVTRHVEDAHALEQARRAADTANEAKTLFLATMSHEIRTPLYGVLGTLELLGLTPLEPRQLAYLNTIQRSSATLFQLISDVLDVSKIESGQMAIEPVEFCPLDMLEDTLHTYAAFAERKGLLLYACTDARLPGRVLGDPMRIRQILNNLLSNAIKFTDTGRVVLRTRVLELTEGKVSLEWQVTDTGIGIGEPQQAKLFELFYQVKDASGEGGAGLGLPICKWLSELMGGQMKVVSDPGLGSSFSLKMNLLVLPGELPDCPAIERDPTPVYVRAPLPELGQSYCDWLERLGVAATLTIPPQAPDNPQALLVEVLAAPPELPWSGPRICCISGGRNPAEYTDGHWDVDMHDLRAVAQAIVLARQGACEPASEAPEPGSVNLQLHILVAEDNPINQAILKEQLEALGCSAVVVANGEQALHLWQPEVFDLVLTDVNMPVMNGYELAKALRAHDNRLPIIGVTANAMREEGLRCMEVGMNAWIVKPLSLQTLRAHLIKLCKPMLHNAPSRIDTETLSASPAATPNDSVKLSPAMRPLFISTMQQDIALIRSALEQQDARTIAERLHSMAGALGAVQASNLASHCIDLEYQLHNTRLDAPLTQKVQQALKRLATILSTLA
ncbi:hybrid sensor histidine kinase/response regulator [Pseudomonas sp. BBP2017]|uniref:hybrid sensor histidine kinase/response regulator n=1 Tax=Pseudomonas sp. BBP2017 TaxID=2109731 RepID=UPI000D11FCA2|nr:hybrid sensor histidine kinase/response regulator [Pseudomonas sp. BBP2017]PSS48251.1 hybrid sensor histidine kinase/response regulator [Pseudomonas sp. BBP2017]